MDDGTVTVYDNPTSFTIKDIRDEQDALTISEDPLSFDVNANYGNGNVNKTVIHSGDEALKDYISETFFYQPDSDDPIILSVDGKPLKLKYDVKPGKELAKKLVRPDWFESCDKYYVVSKNSNNADLKDPNSFTICLIIDDDQDRSTYICAIRQPGRYSYLNSRGEVINVNGLEQIKGKLRKINTNPELWDRTN
ncbi:hypothetical protein [Sharpea azabuensis]|uniref:hypothetical protein n=1 Tax=Sharpea azabuensis TaxID=322505 RepID=UPI0015684265|nr:hypothetical protein [Sharpea azabuensis]